MNNLFDNTEKIVKFIRINSEEVQIQKVLNPLDRTFIDEQRAKELGILSNGYYRNGYGGLIPLHIAASKGLIELLTNDQIQIEYYSKQTPVFTILTIHQVYDSSQQCLISCRQAIDRGYLNLDLFSYVNVNISMPIHQAFYRGLILGEIRTNIRESKPIIPMNEQHDVEYEDLLSSFTNIINSLSEFRNTIHVIDSCELTSDGSIRLKKTGKCYLLTQAIDLGLISIKDMSIKKHIDHSINQSTHVNDTMSSTMNVTHDDDEMLPFFSDTFILDLLKGPGGGGGVTDEIEKNGMQLSNMKQQFLPAINTC